MKSPKALQRPSQAASRRAGNDRTIGLQTTARFSLNDRTIQPQRPHDSASTTARFGLNDRTIQPQRPHDSASTTARCRKTEKKDDPSWQNTSRKVLNKRKK